jgi:hypothetical protein
LPLRSRQCLRSSHNARNATDAYALFPCNGPDALARRAGGSDRLDLGCVIRDAFRMTRSRPFGLCPRQTSHDTFADHGAFKLSEHAKHLKHRAAGSVETLLVQIEIHALGVKIPSLSGQFGRWRLRSGRKGQPTWAFVASH